MKLFALLLTVLASCTLNVDSPGDETMNPYDINPHDIHPWAPKPVGGHDPNINYNRPHDIHKDPVLRAWQANIRVTSNNVKVGDPKTLLNVGFPEPTVYTAQFSITSASQLPGGPVPIRTGVDSIRCQAILNWTVEGNQVQRIFDIGNGTTISGAGSGAIISVQDLTATLPSSGGANNVDYSVSVSITKGTRAQFKTPIISPGACSILNGAAQAVPNVIGPVTILRLAQSGSAVWPVPQNAGVISVKVSLFDPSTPATRLTGVLANQMNALGTIAYYGWEPDIDTDFVPLVPGTQQILVTNNLADLVSASLIWGIDG